MGRLSAKQSRFVEEYLIDLNGTQAAIRAGYSPKTAEVTASRLLRNVKVQVAIADAFQARNERTQVTQDMVIQELARLGFANLGDHLVWDNGGVTVTSSVGLSEDAVRAVAEVYEHITADGTRTIRLKLHDKLAALDKLAKHLGMFVQRQEVVGDKDAPFTVSIAQLAREAREYGPL